MDNATEVINVIGLKVDAQNQLIRRNEQILCTTLNEEDGSTGEAFINQAYLQSLLPQEEIQENYIKDFATLSSVDTYNDYDIEDFSENEGTNFEDTEEDLNSDMKWPDKKVELLVKCYEQIWEKKENKKKMPKILWEMTAKEVNEIGKCSYTSQDCSNKLKSLKRSYKNQKKMQETTGGKRSTWKHFDVMHNLFHKKPEITPVATSSSITGFQPNKDKKNKRGAKSSSSDEEVADIKQRRQSKKTESEVDKLINFLQTKEEKRNTYLDRFLSILEKKEK